MIATGLNGKYMFQFRSVSCVWLFATQWAYQASLSITNSWSLLTLMSIDLVMPSKHLILCWLRLFLPSIFPSIRSFPVSWLITSSGQSIGALASVLSMTIQGWFSLGLPGSISLLSKGLSKVFSSTTVQKYQFFSAQPHLWSSSHIRTWLLEKPELWRGQQDVSNQQLDWSSFCFSESCGQIPWFILSTVKSARL